MRREMTCALRVSGVTAIRWLLSLLPLNLKTDRRWQLLLVITSGPNGTEVEMTG
jgi:hypothetical protein